MIKFLFSVYDSKAAVYSNPFVSLNQAVALRDFNRAATDSNSDISRFPEDYTLVELGEFDDETSVMHLHTQPVNLGHASQFKG